MADFYVSVKSTIDRLAVDIASSLSIGFVELDDTVNVDEALGSPNDLIVYQMVDMREDHSDPLWSLEFQVGGKTTLDAANYDLAEIVSGIRGFISKGGYVHVMDYSQVAPPTQVEGDIIFIDVSVDPQAFDGASGIRMLTVQSKAIRYL